MLLITEKLVPDQCASGTIVKEGRIPDPGGGGPIARV